MSQSDREHLAQRLTQILIKLDQGDTLQPAELAAEFGVSLRTVQRDLNERLGFLPLETAGNTYRLHVAALGKLSLLDLRRFASLAGVQGLFPDLSLSFLRELFDQQLESAWLVKGYEYENNTEFKPIFTKLEQAIRERVCVGFVYAKAELGAVNRTVKTYEPIFPYKLVNHAGVWYLAAEHEHKLKAFALGKIERLLVLNRPFAPRADLLEMLLHEDSIWLNASKSKVVLKVARKAAIYFERRKLVSGQIIDRRLEDGGLIISAQIAHPDQILPIVRYWIPHVQIIEPDGLRDELERGFRSYLSLMCA